MFWSNARNVQTLRALAYEARWFLTERLARDVTIADLFEIRAHENERSKSLMTVDRARCGECGNWKP